MKKIYKGADIVFSVNLGSYSGDFDVIITNGETTLSKNKNDLILLSTNVYKSVIDTNDLTDGMYKFVIIEKEPYKMIGVKDLFYLINY